MGAKLLLKQGEGGQTWHLLVSCQVKENMATDILSLSALYDILGLQVN